MDQLLESLLTLFPLPAPLPDVDTWWSRHREATRDIPTPIHRAMVGGFVADRPAYAFAAGYQEAIQCLLAGAIPDPGQAKTALCATEEGGNHPRAIRTHLAVDGDRDDTADRIASGPAGVPIYRMHGEKRWATLGSRAERYLVLASAGRQDDRGRNVLTAVLIPADRDGIAVTDAPAAELPFVPEIAHARLGFDNVLVKADEILPGDGYDRYLKPFRTIEDCHVHAALAAWQLQVARRAEWPEHAIEAILALLSGASALAAADPSSPATHLALAGLIARAETLAADHDGYWPRVDRETRARWKRDRALLQVAGKARKRRREVAWSRLRPSR